MDFKLSGLASFALFGAAAFTLRSAAYLPDPAEAAAWLSETSAGITVAAYLIGLAGVALVWTAGRAKALLDDAEGLATIGFGGAVAALVAMSTGFFVAIPQSHRIIEGQIDAATATIAYDTLMVGAGNVVAFGLALLLGAFALAGLRSSALRPWFGWTGIVVAVALLTPIQYALGLFGFLWVAFLPFQLRKEAAEVLV
jgi:hypothetical protein